MRKKEDHSLKQAVVPASDAAASPLVVTHVEVLELLLQLQPDLENKRRWLKRFKKGSDVLRKLPNAFFDRGDEKPMPINRNTIGEVIQLSLEKARFSLSSEHDYAFIRVGPPTTMDGRIEQLKKNHGVLDLHVLTEDESDHSRVQNLGRRAAAVFTQMVKEYDNPMVSIGGGQTMHQMIPWLRLNVEDTLLLVAANMATRKPKTEKSDRGPRGRRVYDSSHLAMRVHELYHLSDSAIISLPPLPVEEVMEGEVIKEVADPVKAARYHSGQFADNPHIRRVFRNSLTPDILFLGAGNFYADSPTIARLYHLLGIDGRKLEMLRPRPVGDINFCFFDAEGRDLTSQILLERMEQLKVYDPELASCGSFFKDEPFCHPFLVGMNMRCLQELVRQGKRVVVVAGGAGAKAEALFALLCSRTINGLVTDHQTLERLLEMEGSRVRGRG